MNKTCLILLFIYTFRFKRTKFLYKNIFYHEFIINKLIIMHVYLIVLIFISLNSINVSFKIKKYK